MVSFIVGKILVEEFRDNFRKLKDFDKKMLLQALLVEKNGNCSDAANIYKILTK